MSTDFCISIGKLWICIVDNFVEIVKNSEFTGLFPIPKSGFSTLGDEYSLFPVYILLWHGKSGERGVDGRRKL